MISREVSLKQHNTFGLECTAEEFVRVQSTRQLQTVLERHGSPALVLGGGSNVLLCDNVKGLVIWIDIPGIELLETAGDTVKVRAGAGVVWHDFVQHCITLGWGGVENLSLIPGSVGAAPMQNIGAYGVEIKDVFHALDAVEIATGLVHTFDSETCAFGYRESVFKRALRGQYIITSVTFELSLKHNLNTTYGAIEEELKAMGVQELNIQTVSQAVIRIRQSKLPDPAKIGNAGSFFKNPVIPVAQFDALKAKFPQISSYPAGEGKVKIAAGWLIDQAGWKGHSRGEHGVHDKQALVLVNKGSAKGNDIYKLSEDILVDVYSRYGITLEREVNIIGR